MSASLVAPELKGERLAVEADLRALILAARADSGFCIKRAFQDHKGPADPTHIEVSEATYCSKRVIDSFSGLNTGQGSHIRGTPVQGNHVHGPLSLGPASMETQSRAAASPIPVLHTCHPLSSTGDNMLAGSDQDLQSGMLIEQLISFLHTQVVSLRISLAEAEFFAEAVDL
ncbi:hypothetical protein B0T16DRAFT_451163 [Cercophora newfieldiana]|uniref:Uncharacterized protein n=1 Tax=Cercophora newfieldiana TaxID=92897 RepID=A0AA39YMY0_9PEZI|nr:hypothetical protein B0T16DRAFT_451163 [Cercophora newfieldiana]